jgi:hypothetical protein
MYHRKAVLLLEFGNGAAGTIQAYSEQRASRLPLKLRRRDDIIEHFQEWMALEILA